MGDTDQGGPVTAERVNVARIIDGHDGAGAALISRNQHDHLRRAGRPVESPARRPGRASASATAIASPSICGNGHPFVDRLPRRRRARCRRRARSTRRARRRSCSASWPPSTPSPSSSIAARRPAGVTSTPASWPRSAHVITRRRRRRRRGDRVRRRCSTSEPLPVAGVDPDHLAVLMFTSGTAGAPRAAMLTHGNLLANIEQARSVPDRVSADDVVYGVIPVYHIFGLNVVLGLSLSVGADGRARAALRPGDRARVDPRPQGHGRSPARRRCGSPSPTSTRRRPTPSPRCAWPCPARPSCRSPCPSGCANASASQVAEGYGLTEASPIVTSSVGPAAAVRLRRPGARRDRAAPRRRRRRRRARRRRRRDLGARPERVRRLPRRPRGHGAGAHRRRLAAHRRHRPDRRRRPAVPRRPGQGPRSSCPGSTSSRPRSRTSWRPIPTSPRSASSACRTRTPARRSRRSSCSSRAPRLDEDALIDYARDHLARYKCPSKVLFVDELPRNGQRQARPSRARARRRDRGRGDPIARPRSL